MSDRLPVEIMRLESRGRAPRVLVKSSVSRPLGTDSSFLFYLEQDWQWPHGQVHIITILSSKLLQKNKLQMPHQYMVMVSGEVKLNAQSCESKALFSWSRRPCQHERLGATVFRKLCSVTCKTAVTWCTPLARCRWVLAPPMRTIVR
eukprot:scpid95400/ scgid32567/ 